LQNEANFYAYVDGDPVDFNDPSGLFKIKGKWCGPNWTGGKKEPYIPKHDKNGYYKKPDDYVDWVCSQHNICYGECRDKFPCEAGRRRHCLKGCDRTFVRQIFTNPKGYISLWGPVPFPIGPILGVTIGIHSLFVGPGREGGADPDHPVVCCHSKAAPKAPDNPANPEPQ
jgi:hypothetical protein